MAVRRGAPISYGRVHNFGGANYVTYIASSGSTFLFWSNPLGNASDDYDLFRLDSTGSNVLSAGQNDQLGNGYDPVESVSAGSAGDRLVIVKYAGSVQFLRLDTNRGRLSTATAGSTHGHATTSAANTFSVAATPAVGPYPSPFNSANVVESFSSDGPRQLFFDGDGSAHSQVLNKPDFTAADGVSVTGVGGFGSSSGSCGAVSGRCFFGTTAAAPHAAAIAALVKSKNPALTAAQVTTALLGSAVDIMGAAWDRDSGAGILMADAAVGSISAPLITSGPSNQMIGYGGTANLSVGATGSGLSYQWYHGLAGDTTHPFAGATSSAYMPTLVGNTNAWARVTNSWGHTDSTSALVTVTFTDALVAGTTVFKAVHLNEPRARTDAVRAYYSLSPAVYTNTITAGGSIKAIDITQTQTALSQAFVAAGLGKPTFTTTPTTGSIISLADIADLRAKLQQIEK